MANAPAWEPRHILEVIDTFPTESSVAHVRTDVGEAYLKAIGGKGGEHVLACEMVGTQLANWLGLPTFTFAVMELTDALPIRLANGEQARPGPAFITRAERGQPWGGDGAELDLLDNPDDLARLVVFDTWALNCDRYQPRKGEAPRINRDNVFLSRVGATRGRFLLKAADQGHCFTCGGDLTVRLRNTGTVQENRMYGCFPEFRPRIDRPSVLGAVGDVENITRTEIETFLLEVPSEWDVSTNAREAWAELIEQRARYIRRILERHFPATSLFDDSSRAEGQP